MTEEACDSALKASLAGVSGATLSWMESNGVRTPFVILDSWDDLSKVQDNLNRHLPDGLCELEAVSRWGLSDEYATCDRCMRMVRTSPDSWSWQPDWAYIDDDRLCSACLRAEPEAYLAVYRNSQNLLNDSIIKPDDYGYARVGVRFERGLHQGQAADPIRIGRILSEADIDFLFTGVPGQFDVQFWVWVPSADLLRATSLLEEGDTNLDYDPGTEMAKALRGEATPYYKVQTRTISAEEFISGRWKSD